MVLWLEVTNPNPDSGALARGHCCCNQLLRQVRLGLPDFLPPVTSPPAEVLGVVAGDRLGWGWVCGMLLLVGYMGSCTFSSLFKMRVFAHMQLR